MKKLIMVMILVTLAAGCGRIKRTGTVCVEPFSTNNFKTSDPVEVKQDTVDAVRSQLKPAIEKRIPDKTDMTIVDDCNKADYKLTGRIHTVNTAVQGSRTVISLFPGDIGTISQRLFGVGIKSTLTNVKSLEIILEYDHYHNIEKLDTTLDHLAEDLSRNLEYVKNIK
jgi:hypothetical protein